MKIHCVVLSLLCVYRQVNKQILLDILQGC